MINSLPIGMDLAVIDEGGEAEVVITYDIPDDDRRSKISEVCKVYGRNVQRSVFECTVTEEQYNELVGKLHKSIKEEEDHIYVYLLSQPTDVTSGELGTAKELRGIMSKIGDLSAEERKELQQELEL